MEQPFLTHADLESLITAREYHQLPGTTAIVCVLTTLSGFKVYGTAPGPMNAANFNEEQDRSIAFDAAFDQLWKLEAYHRKAQVSDRVAPVGPTEDMLKLPDGSAAFQIINQGQFVDMRGVLIGGQTFDVTNAAHRVLAVINGKIDEIVAEATGSKVNREQSQDIDDRLRQSQKPADDVSLKAASDEGRIVAGVDLRDGAESQKPEDDLP